MSDTAGGTYHVDRDGPASITGGDRIETRHGNHDIKVGGISGEWFLGEEYPGDGTPGGEASVGVCSSDHGERVGLTIRFDQGSQDHGGLASLTPEQARRLAGALLRRANLQEGGEQHE